MRIIRELCQVTLPTEAHVTTQMCEAETTDPGDGITWYCTRYEGHDGPHVAIYGQDHGAPMIGSAPMIGLAWTEDTTD